MDAELFVNGTGYAEKDILNNWAAEYAKREIDAHKSASPIDHPDNSVTESKIADAAVSTDKIATAAVTEQKIADNAVTSDKIDEYSVGTVQLASAAVTNSKIASGAVTNDKIANNAIKSFNLAPNAVQSNKIEDGAVTTTKIANNTVTGVKIASKTVTSSNIAPDSIIREVIADGAVGTNELSNTAVTATKIANGAVTEQKIADNAVTPEKTTFCGYSTTPVQIGTWIDGTPVWRMAWSVPTLLASHKSAPAITLPIKSTGRIAVINVRAWGIDGDKDPIQSDTGYYYFDPNTLTRNSPDSYTLNASDDLVSSKLYVGWEGYIEFVTPESNLT